MAETAWSAAYGRGCPVAKPTADAVDGFSVFIAVGRRRNNSEKHCDTIRAGRNVHFHFNGAGQMLASVTLCIREIRTMRRTPRRLAPRIPIHLAAVLALLVTFFAASPAQAQNRFWLQNNTGNTIQEAYVSPSRLSNWGPDILGSGVLPAGQQVWVTPYFGDCILDVRVRYANGREETRMGLNACNISRIPFGGGGSVGAAIGPGIARGGNPSFNFINQSGQTIRELYASLSTEGGWGSDRLGQNVMQPGQSTWVDLPQGGPCTIDIRVVYMSGQSRELRGQETCSVQNFNWR